MAMQNYYYNQQVKRSIVQFMAIFANMKCEIGENDREKGTKIIDVPVKYGNKDRVVAWTRGDHTQNKPLRLPVMSVNMSNILMAPELRKGVDTVRRTTHMPQGGVFPDDITTVKQIMPIPYRLNMDLSIYTSNTEQRLQILEQILMLFNPSLQIQTSDRQFDWTKLSYVELENLTNEDNYPIGGDSRMLIYTLTFNMPIYISPPANLRDDFVEKIFMRLGVVNQALESNEEIVADLDAQGVEYEKIFDLDDLDLNL